MANPIHSETGTNARERTFSAKLGVWIIMASGMQLRQKSPRVKTLKLLGEGGASKDRFREGVKSAPEAGGGCGRDQPLRHTSVDEEGPGSLEAVVMAEAISDSMTV